MIDLDGNFKATLAKMAEGWSMETDAQRSVRLQSEESQEERRRKGERHKRIQRLRGMVSLADGDVDRIVDGTADKTTAMLRVQSWLDGIHGKKPGTPKMLVLCGGIGAGKTFAAAHALDTLGGVCIRASRLHIALDPWRNEAREEDQRLNPASPALVVLDDLGTERDPKDPRWAEAFFELVDARMDRGRWTLITSNLRRARFRERYDARVIDRLNHVAKAIELPDASKRQQEAGL